MIKICFLLGGFTGNGGIGRVTSILINKMCQMKQYSIYTLSYYSDNKPNLYSIEAAIQQDFLFDNPINMTKGILSGGIRKLNKYLILNDIDIIIACGALFYPISVIACRGIKTKCICWEHSNVQNKADHSFQLLCRKIGAKKADLVVVLTKYDKKSYVDKYHIDNVVQIYNPIDENLFQYVKGYDSKSKKIITVGRLSYQKNMQLLIDIAKDILEINPGWTWDIYGEGEDRKELQDKIDNNKLQNRVKLKGQVKNLYELYSGYAMMVMTSRYEGFPMCLLEGTANGLPLISFDVLTGPREIIVHGENGFLIKPFEKEKMEQFISDLIKDSDGRQKMALNGKKISYNYRLDTILEEWSRIFDQVLNMRGK